MSVKTTIRKYREQDKIPLIRLWKEVFPNDPSHNDPAKVLEAKLAVDDLIFIALHDDCIVGACMAGYDGHRGWLYAVAVTADQRRRRTGSLLIQHALDNLKALGCIKVNLQIRATNTEVAAFYKSLGFSVEERLSMGMLI